MVRKALNIFFLIIIAASCSKGPLGFLNQKGPWEKYADKLKSSELDKTPMGKKWLHKGESVLKAPVVTDLPVNINGAFAADEVEAIAWKFAVKRGEVLHIRFNWKSSDSSLVFIDVYSKSNDKELLSASSVDSNIAYEIEEDDTLRLRLQPQLLAEGFFELTLEKGAVYSLFPVYGKESRDVWSVWGDPRDGGKRKHEGVDIFAPRGTPVISPAGGIVSSVRNGGLGGKSVFVRDHKRTQSLYFAHLDSQFVRSGQILKAGDTIGTVGNTGNAKYTKPHLHFGIYAGRAVDPLPFINTTKPKAEPAMEFPEDEILVVKGAKANFRKGPSTGFAVIRELENNEPVKLLSAVKDWYIIKTVDGRRGYLHHSLLGKVQEKSFTLTDGEWIYWDPLNINDSIWIDEEKLKLIGTYKEFRMFHTSGGIKVWNRL